VRQMQEKHWNKAKKLYCALVHLEKTFNRVPRKVSRCSVTKACMEARLMNECSHGSYDGAQTVVIWTADGDSSQ